MTKSDNNHQTVVFILKCSEELEKQLNLESAATTITFKGLDVSLINSYLIENKFLSAFMVILIYFSKELDIKLESLLLMCDFKAVEKKFPDLDILDPTIIKLKSFLDKPHYENIVVLDSIIKDIGINFFGIKDQILFGIKYNTFRSWMTNPESTRNRKPKVTAWNQLILGLISYKKNGYTDYK